MLCDATDRCIIQAASSAPPQSLFFMIHPQHFLAAPGSWFPQFPVSSAAHCSRHKLAMHAILATYWIVDTQDLGRNRLSLTRNRIISSVKTVHNCTLHLSAAVYSRFKLQLLFYYNTTQKLTWCYTMSASAARVGSAPHWRPLLSSCEARDSAVRRCMAGTRTQGRGCSPR